MTAPQLAQNAYAMTAQSVRTPRSTEYEVIAKITAALKTAASDDNSSFAALVAALHDNRRLWTLLAADVVDDDNKLPKDLRAQIFYLAEFVSQQTSKVLRREASPDALLDVNGAILRGLKPKGS